MPNFPDSYYAVRCRAGCLLRQSRYPERRQSQSPYNVNVFLSGCCYQRRRAGRTFLPTPSELADSASRLSVNTNFTAPSSKKRKTNGPSKHGTTSSSTLLGERDAAIDQCQADVTRPDQCQADMARPHQCQADMARPD